MKILIAFSISTALLAMEPKYLEEQICQESGGTIYHGLCWCDKGNNIDPYSQKNSIGSYIDPYFTICTENGPKDKISQIYDNIYDNKEHVNVTDFTSLMSSYEDNVCDPNLDKLQKGALAVIKHSLRKRFGIKYENEPAKTFNDEITSLWQKIVNELDKENRNDPDYKNLGQFNNTNVLGDIEYFLQQSLKEGLIPLPVFDNNEQIFRTKALINYIFIGVAPIDISKVSIQNLNSNTAHPFSHNFFTYLLGVVSHDLQHALLISQNIQRLGIPLRTKQYFHYSPSKCSIYKEKFDNILNMKDDHKNNKYAISLYFSLHESPFYPERVGTRFSFYEFALEFVLKKTLGDLLFHNSSKERTKGLCRQILYADNKKSYGFLKPIIDVLSIDYAGRKKEEDIAKIPNNNTNNLFMSYVKKNKPIDYSWYPKLDENNIAVIEDQMTSKLLLKCYLLGNFFSEADDQKSKFDLTSEINKILTTKINDKNLLDKFADMIYRRGKNLEEFYQSFKYLFKDYPYIVDRWSKNMNIWNQVY